MRFTMSTSDLKTVDGPSVIIDQPEATLTKRQISRKCIIGAVAGVLVVLLTLAAILIGVYMFIDGEKNLIKEMVKINNFQVERQIDVKENVVQYHVKNSVYEQWTVDDLNSFLEVVKIKTNEGTIHCFVYPLNDTTRTDMNKVSQPMNELNTLVQETYFLVSNTSIPNTAFLSQTPRDMCDGIPIHWINLACPGTLEDVVRVKRDCGWGCWLVAGVVVVAVIVQPQLSPLLRPVGYYVVSRVLDPTYTGAFK